MLFVLFSDIGTIDKDGYLRIFGRIKEMIIRGGVNIYPREIEELILTNPAIADVHVWHKFIKYLELYNKG